MRCKALLTVLVAAMVVVSVGRGLEVQMPATVQNRVSVNNHNSQTNESDDRTPILPVTTSARVKRLVHGLKLVDISRDKDSFQALKYFVVISHAHQCNYRHRYLFNEKFFVNLDFLSEFKAHCISKFRDPRCSGSMIAPNIVQTACHCLATFYKFQPTENRTSALEKSVWEDHNLIFRPIEDPSDKHRPKPGSREQGQYLGVTTLATIAERQFMFSKKYYVHRRCTHLDKRVFSHDFGLIILNKQYLSIPQILFVQPRPTFGNKFIPAKPPDMNQLNMAPTYTAQTTDENWMWANLVEPTCLIIGTGWSFWAYGVYLELPLPWQVSHTWRTATSYTSCANWTARRVPGIHVNGSWQYDGMKTTYEDLATWICTTPISRLQNSFAGLGDDGGPFTCDNRYIGVLGAGFQHSNKFAFLSEVELVHSLNYATETHAEYRQGLLELAEDERPFLDPQLRAFDPAVYHNLKRKESQPLVKRSVSQDQYYRSNHPITSGVPNKQISSLIYFSSLCISFAALQFSGFS